MPRIALRDAFAMRVAAVCLAAFTAPDRAVIGKSFPFRRKRAPQIFKAGKTVRRMGSFLRAPALTRVHGPSRLRVLAATGSVIRDAMMRVRPRLPLAAALLAATTLYAAA